MSLDKRIRYGWVMGASAALAMLGMGSSCPGTGKSGNFENGRLLGATSTVTITKTWRSPILIDIGQVDTSSDDLNRHQNIDTALSTTGSFPMAIFNDASKDFFAIFNRAGQPLDPGPVSTVLMFATQQKNFTSSSWVTGFSDFTQFFDGTTTATNAQRPMVSVDSNGNAMMVAMADRVAAPTDVRPFASLHVYGNGAWNAPTHISNTAEAGDVDPKTAAINVDNFNQFVVIFGNASKAYFNQYRPSLGWRFSGAAFAGAVWNLTADGNIVGDLGMSLGFDGYGNGWALYTATTPKIMAARWRGDTLGNFDPTNGGGVGTDYQEISLGDPNVVFGYPKVWVNPDGEAHAFYYSNQAGNNANLMYIAASATALSDPATWGSKAALQQFDSGTGVGNVFMLSTGDVLQPLLAYNGYKAAVAFIKSDGTNRRLYVFKYNGATWKSLGTADANTGDVTWADIAINSGGEIAVGYSASSGGLDHVFGNVYTSGVWAGATQIDSLSNLAAGVVGVAKPRPAVSIDASGYAMVGFSMDDTATSLPSARRRAVTATFR